MRLSADVDLELDVVDVVVGAQRPERWMYDVCLSIGPLIPRVPSFVICSAKIIVVGCRGYVVLLDIVDVSEGED